MSAIFKGKLHNLLLAGLLCCSGCPRKNSSDASNNSSGTSDHSHKGTANSSNKHDDNTYYQLAQKQDTGQATVPKTTLQQTDQPIVTHFSWGHIEIRKPGGGVEKTLNGEDWVITPKGCQKWDYKKFGRKPQDRKISHLWPNKPKNEQGTGVLPYAIHGLLQLAGKLDVVIVSKGVNNSLGVNQATIECLKELKRKGSIQDYHILNSKEVPKKHNQCVEKGLKTGTLLHTTC